MELFDWNHGFTLDFDLKSGFSRKVKTTKRFLSDMKNFFGDLGTVEEILKKENPLIYEYYELGCPEREGDLAFGTTIIYPGIIGNEYYMTKGHFHRKIDTAEVYYVLDGEGYMVMEDPAGNTKEIPVRKGEAVYVPRSYAHRSVNTGKMPFVLFFTFAADAGHDYGTIEQKGYRHKICLEDGKVSVLKNQKWNWGGENI